MRSRIAAEATMLMRMNWRPGSPCHSAVHQHAGPAVPLDRVVSPSAEMSAQLG
jgi:hypothetical protein